MLNIFKVQSKIPDDDKKAPLPPPNAKPDFRQYQDPAGDFSSKELAAGIWYVKHRALIRRMLISGLITLSAALWLYSLARWGSFLIFGLAEDKALYRSLARSANTGLSSRFSAEPLRVLSSSVLPGGVNKFDAVAELSNPNEFFSAAFSYHFIVSSEPTPSQTAFLLPGETRPVAALGLAADGDAAFVIENISWARPDPHRYPKPTDWQAERVNFAVESARVFLPEPGTKATRVTFDFINNSPYNYIAPEFLVGLYSADSLVAVAPLFTGRFDSLEKKSLDVRSFAPNLRGDEVRVFPLVNPYDPAVYAQ